MKSAQHHCTSLRAEIAALVDRIDLRSLNGFARTLREAGTRRGAIYLLGNGASASLALHLAADLIQISKRAPRKFFPRIAPLCADVSTLTAISNDYGYREVFLVQLIGPLVQNDVVIGISASGRSPNVLKGLTLARKRRAVALGLTSTTGERMARLCDICFMVDSRNKFTVEAVHVAFTQILIASMSDSLGVRWSVLG